MVGSPGSDAGGVDSGEVSLIFGFTGFELDAVAIPGTPGYRAGTAVALTRGFSSHTIFPDVVVGAPNPTGVGEVRVHDNDLNLITTFTGGSSGGLYGAAVASADYLGFGAWSIAVGAPSHSTALATELGMAELIQPQPLVPLRLFGQAAGDRLGAAVFLLEDVDGDGSMQLMVASAGIGTAEVRGLSFPILPAIRKFFGGAGSPSFVPIGDIDQDGRPDVAVGWSSSSGPTGVATGVVTVHHGDPEADDSVVETAPSCPVSIFPTLDVLGCPGPGEMIEITLWASSSSDAAIFVGAGNGTVPAIPGCPLHIGPLTPAVLVVPNIPPLLTVPVQLPQSALMGDVWLQAIARPLNSPTVLRVSNALRVDLH